MGRKGLSFLSTVSGTADSPGPAPRRPYPLSTRFALLPGALPVRAWGAGDFGNSCPDTVGAEKAMNPSSSSRFDQPTFPSDRTPRSSSVAENLARYGAESLSDSQIIEALLNRATPERAETILSRAGSLGMLAALGPSELQSLGLSRAEMARFAVLQEVQRRSSRTQERIRINSPRAAGTYLMPKVQGWTEERFGLLALNAKGDLLADRVLAHGTATACLISPREFFREALKYGACSALAWHNHPSGDPAPSREDIQLTRRLRSAGENLGVPLADHIVLGVDTWHSFRAAEGWDTN